MENGMDSVTEHFPSSRIFSPWQFTISHGQLLIRSSKSNTHARNIDLTFLDVVYMELPDVFTGLDIDIPTADELQRLGARRGDKMSKHTVFVLCAEGQRFFVVASRLRISVNDLKFGESGF